MHRAHTKTLADVRYRSSHFQYAELARYFRSTEPTVISRRGRLHFLSYVPNESVGKEQETGNV